MHSKNSEMKNRADQIEWTQSYLLACKHTNGLAFVFVSIFFCSFSSKKSKERKKNTNTQKRQKKKTYKKRAYEYIKDGCCRDSRHDKITRTNLDTRKRLGRTKKRPLCLLYPTLMDSARCKKDSKEYSNSFLLFKKKKRDSCVTRCFVTVYFFFPQLCSTPKNCKGPLLRLCLLKAFPLFFSVTLVLQPSQKAGKKKEHFVFFFSCSLETFARGLQDEKEKKKSSTKKKRKKRMLKKKKKKRNQHWKPRLLLQPILLFRESGSC